MICKECEKFVSAKDGKIINGEFICNDCINDNYIKCGDCGEYHKKNEMYYIEDTQEYVCENCFENNGYFQCEDCRNFYSGDECIWIEDKQISVCEDCAERNYYRCDNCGYWFESVAAWGCDVTICSECWDSGEWMFCNACGRIIRTDEGYWGDDDCFYCDHCIDYHLNGVIKNYHSFNDWDFRTEYNETTNSKPTYFYGFEIEVEGDTDCAERTNELLDGKAVLMKDGSVEGFEIVTDPMTENYYYNSFLPILENTMDYLKENNFTGHNAGGIHIHVTKEACKNWEGIKTLLNFNNIELWVMLTQRKKDKLQEWARLYGDQFNGDDTRYQALNNDGRTNTFEFRIFNSNLRVERITKNFEIVLSLIDFANNNIINNYTDIKRYIKFVKDNKNKYETLYNFMIEKKIIKENILKELQKQLKGVLQLCA